MKAGLAVIVVNGQETLNMIKYRGDQMKRILSIVMTVIILVAAITSSTVTFAASMPTTTITSIKAQNKAFTVKWKKKQILQDTKFNILLIVSLKREIKQ